MGINLGALVSGGMQGYKFAKDMQGQEDDRLRKKSEGDREAKKATREDASIAMDDQVNKKTMEYAKSLMQARQEIAPLPVAAQGVMPPQGSAENDGQQSAPRTPMAAGLPNATPKNNAPGNDEFLDLAKYRSKLYVELGDYNKALTAHNESMQFASKKLQGEQAQRAETGRIATAGILNGDYSGLAKLYDMFPDGKKLGNVVPNEDGAISVTTIGKDGKETAPMKFQNSQALANAAMSMVDTDKALDNLDKLGKMEIDRAKQIEDARHNKATEGNDAIKARAEAAKSKAKTYKIEGSEVSNALGDSAVNKKGEPITDPMSGRQIVNRNPEKDKAFYQWMAANGITDTNEGLAKYLSQPAPPQASGVTRKSGVSASSFD